MTFRDEMSRLVGEAEKLAAALASAAALIGDKDPAVTERLQRRASEAATFIEAMRPWLKTDLAASYVIA